MKIIDILVAKANGTLEDGFKFCFEDTIYTYKKDRNKIQKGDNWANEKCIGAEYCLENHLNDEVLLFKDNSNKVEVMEETKEIEELEISKLQRCSYIEFMSNITDKLNEVINKLNKEREEK